MYPILAVTEVVLFACLIWLSNLIVLPYQLTFKQLKKSRLRKRQIIKPFTCSLWLKEYGGQTENPEKLDTCWIRQRYRRSLWRPFWTLQWYLLHAWTYWHSPWRCQKEFHKFCKSGHPSARKRLIYFEETVRGISIKIWDSTVAIRKSGQGDPGDFIGFTNSSFIMYPNWLFGTNPTITEMCTRTFPI